MGTVSTAERNLKRNRASYYYRRTSHTRIFRSTNELPGVYANFKPIIPNLPRLFPHSGHWGMARTLPDEEGCTTCFTTYILTLIRVPRVSPSVYENFIEKRSGGFGRGEIVEL